MSAGSLRLLARFAGGKPPPAALYADGWPGPVRRGVQLAYQGWKWLCWRVQGGDALLLAGAGLPAAKGRLHLLRALDWPALRAGACVLRGASLERLRAGVGLDAEAALELHAADADVLVIAGQRAGRAAVVHLCDDAQRLARYAESLQTAHAHFGPLGLASLLPALLDQRIVAGVAMLVQQRLGGATVQPGTLDAPRLLAHVAAALVPLRALQNVGTFVAEGADAPLRAAVQESLQQWPQWRDALDAPLAHLHEWHGWQRLPAVLAHGDYWLANLLFDSDAKLVGIIDWERARAGAVAGYDAVHLVVHSFAHWRGCPEWQVPCMLWDDQCEPVLERLFELVAVTLQLGMDDLRHIALLVWLAHLRQHATSCAEWSVERRRDWVELPALSARRWLAERR